MRFFSTLFILLICINYFQAQDLQNLPLTAVEDTVPAHYADAYNKMRYCLNDPFNYDPNNYFNPTATTPAPLVMDQYDDTTSFAALSVEANIGAYYGEDSATFWEDNPLANNVIFEFQVPAGQMLAYLDIWGRKNPGLDRRNKNLIVELYNDFGSSISTNTFELSSSNAEYPTFARVDLSAMGLDANMLTLATGIRIRHKVRHNGSIKDDSDFLQVMELRMCTSNLLEEISITGARGGEQNYPNFNDLPKYLYNDAFTYNPLSPLSDQPDLTWKHPTDSGSYTPGLDTALFAVKKGLDNSWLEVFFELKSGQSISCIDLWTDERDNQPSYRYKPLIITLKDSVNGTEWTSPEWNGISHPSHHGRYTFPKDVPHDLLYKATSVHIYNKHGDQELLVIFEARIAGYKRVNTAPIANAGQDIMATWGDTVTLNAKASYDPDWYQTLNYNWIAVGLKLDDPTVAKPKFVAPFVTDTTKYQVMLRVNDGEASPSMDLLNVTIVPPATEAPVAIAGKDTTIIAGENLFISAMKSYDPDNYISMSYQWESLGDYQLADATKPVFSFVAPDVADTTDYSFVLTVSDSIKTSVPDTLVITVVPKASNLEAEKMLGVSLYPNPFVDVTTLNVPDNALGATMSIYDVNGKKVYNSIVRENKVIITSEQLPKQGVYFVSLQKVHMQQVVKVHRK